MRETELDGSEDFVNTDPANTPAMGARFQKFPKSDKGTHSAMINETPATDHRYLAGFRRSCEADHAGRTDPPSAGSSSRTRMRPKAVSKGPVIAVVTSAMITSIAKMRGERIPSS